MKNGFKSYLGIWAVLLVIYNLVIFIARPIIPGFVITYDMRFFIAWLVVLFSFAINLASAFVAFKSENTKKLFYNISLVLISKSVLSLIFVVSIICMLIPNFPAWITAVICAILMSFNIISVLKAQWAAEVVSDIDEKIKVETFFIKSLTADAEGLINRAEGEELKELCKKVYEALRYSDPMQSEKLSSCEKEITISFSNLKNYVLENNFSEAKTISDELLILISDRNNKCKLLK